MLPAEASGGLLCILVLAVTKQWPTSCHFSEHLICDLTVKWPKYSGEVLASGLEPRRAAWGSSKTGYASHRLPPSRGYSAAGLEYRDCDSTVYLK